VLAARRRRYRRFLLFFGLRPFLSSVGRLPGRALGPRARFSGLSGFAARGFSFPRGTLLGSLDTRFA